MADIGKFPGTEMEVFSKYPDSYRLDHPGFGDVLKTPYAKGVITDFKVDDPTDLVGTIHSQVKVTGDWGESDWIPIFYHPKAQYWDSDNYKATDFNQKDGYFERAWMSFRKGDEVAVMIKAGVPVAVVGFADGIPRIGENILKISFDTAAAGKNYMLWGFFGKGQPENYPVPGLNPSGGVLNPWNSKEVGPDNDPLCLTYECPKVASGIQHGDRNGAYWFGDYFPYTDKQAPFSWDGHQKIIISGEGTYNYINEWLVCCGPFMYLFSIKSNRGSESINYQDWIWEYPPGEYIYYNGYTNNTFGMGTDSIVIQSALYNKEIAEKMINSPIVNNNFATDPWYTILPDGRVDNSLYSFNNEDYGVEAWGGGWYFDQKLQGYSTGTNPTVDCPVNVPPEFWNLRIYVPDWNTAKFFVRPHNKNEGLT